MTATHHATIIEHTVDAAHSRCLVCGHRGPDRADARIAALDANEHERTA